MSFAFKSLFGWGEGGVWAMGSLWGCCGVLGCAVGSAQFLTQMMLEHPFEIGSCFPTDGIVALTGKAAEASLEKGKKGSAVILKGGL